MEFLAEILEIIMVVSFGASRPFNVMKCGFLCNEMVRSFLLPTQFCDGGSRFDSLRKKLPLGSGGAQE